MSTLIDAEKLLIVIRDMGSGELLNPEEIAELVKRQPVAYRDIYEDGYIKALHDFEDLAKTDLYTPITFYDEGVNAGIRREINLADYLIQKMRGR